MADVWPQGRAWIFTLWFDFAGVTAPLSAVGLPNVTTFGAALSVTAFEPAAIAVPTPAAVASVQSRTGSTNARMKSGIPSTSARQRPRTRSFQEIYLALTSS